MNAAGPQNSLDDLIHDVNSKCSSLKNAAALLRKASESEKRELLTLMAQEARTLAESLANGEGAPAPGAS